MKDLQRVWELLARNDQLRYFARGSDRTLAGVATTSQKLDTLITSNPDFNWYVTLNPTKRNAPPKARSRDVIEWCWVLIDVDPVGNNADPGQALSHILDTHGLREYCVVLNSGRGHQAWVSLRPSKPTPQVEQSVSAWLRYLDPFAFGCRIDTSCRDLARVARCPGTVNLKTGTHASIISMPSQQLDPEEILKYGEPLEKVDHTPLEPSAPLSKVLPRLSHTAARFLTEGHISPGRHSACYATARSLAESGVSMSVATDLLLRGATLSRPGLPIRDAIRCLRQAYEKGTQ